MMKSTLLTIFVFAGALTLAYGQEGAGKKYDTRDPFECKSMKEPATGAPSPSQVKDYVRCNKISGESIAGGYIYLYENAEFEIGKARPFSAWSDAGRRDIDNTQPVYPIRGAVDSYSCRPPGSMGFPPGKNCNVRKAASFTGTCFKTSFGEWSCQGKLMGDPLSGVQNQVPPPK
ncbi:MAG TPA: hypothetical protein VKV95_17425 [Terriglobia bacterium]|nr:hypothetical protein [Terriglobia bacterium]